MVALDIDSFVHVHIVDIEKRIKTQCFGKIQSLELIIALFCVSAWQERLGLESIIMVSTNGAERIVWQRCWEVIKF